jgi:hypothetical protein
MQIIFILNEGKKMENKSVDEKLAKIEHYSRYQSLEEEAGTKWEELPAEQVEDLINRNIIVSEN